MLDSGSTTLFDPQKVGSVIRLYFLGSFFSSSGGGITTALKGVQSVPSAREKQHIITSAF